MFLFQVHLGDEISFYNPFQSHVMILLSRVSSVAHLTRDVCFVLKLVYLLNKRHELGKDGVKQ